MRNGQGWCEVSIAILIISLIITGILGYITYTLQCVLKCLNRISGQQVVEFGQVSQFKNVVEDFRRDFNIKFDNELANKVTQVLKIGVRPADMMEVVNPVTGKKEMVPIDKGW